MIDEEADDEPTPEEQAVEGERNGAEVEEVIRDRLAREDWTWEGGKGLFPIGFPKTFL
jgi:hypothetical protein